MLCAVNRLQPSLIVAVAILAAPAVASAQGDTQPPAEQPPAATMRIHFVAGAFDGGSRSIAIAGGRVRIRGTVSRHVEGERYTVRVFRGSKKVRAIAAQTKPFGTTGGGRFFVDLPVRRAGTLTIRAEHAASPALAEFAAPVRKLDVARSVVSAGARGPVVRVLQRQLDRLGYAVPRSGRFDDATQRAVLAYRKVNGMARTTALSRDVVRRLLRGRGAFRPKFPKRGRHVEADLSRQVLALIGRGGKVEAVYHVSSGTSGTPTVRGRFRFYMKTPGTNGKGMVHSSYFIRGYAVHGFASVPTYPASHGCLRVPVPDATRIFRWISVGDSIDVYF